MYNVYITSMCDSNKFIVVSAEKDYKDDISFKNFDDSKGTIVKTEIGAVIVYNDGSITKYERR